MLGNGAPNELLMPPDAGGERPFNRKRTNPWADSPVNVLKAKPKKDESLESEVYAETLRKMREGARNLSKGQSDLEPRRVLPLPPRRSTSGTAGTAESTVSHDITTHLPCKYCGAATLPGGSMAEQSRCNFCDGKLCLDCAKECEVCQLTFCAVCSVGR